MKAVTLYTIQEQLNVEDFDLDKLNELAYKPLGEEQMETWGFIPVHEEDLYSLSVENFMTLKLRYTKRDDLDEGKIAELHEKKVARLAREGLPFDVNEEYEKLRYAAMQLASSKDTELLVWFDINNNRFISADTMANSDKVFSDVLKIIPDGLGVELYKQEPAIIEKMMMKWCLDKEPLENIDFNEGGILSSGTIVGKKPSVKNGKTTYTKEEDFVELATVRIVESNYKPHQLDLIYSGGCTAEGDAFFTMQLSNKAEFKGIKFPKASKEGDKSGSILNYVYNHEMTETLNFVAEWLPIMPVVSQMLSNITGELEQTKI